MRIVKALLLSVLAIGFMTSMAMGGTSDLCYIVQDQNSEKCFQLEAHWGNGDTCPSSETNPAFNWCTARAVRSFSGQCCLGHNLTDGSEHTECAWGSAYTSGSMHKCRNYCTLDDNWNICKAKHIYLGICAPNYVGVGC